MRILIADDDATSRLVLASVLKKTGHEVIEAADGLQAWEILREPGGPFLAVLDWVMPEMDGPEVVRRVRAVRTDNPPYIIMLTSRGEKGDIIAGLEAGANDYLAKPFDPGELRARVEVGRRMVELQEALIEARELLAHQATHDPLTGLPNRRAILERLGEECSRAGRRNEVLAVGMCDLDHFKRINDTYGHQSGDEVLCGFARILTDGLRPYDAAGRLGGEEFLVVAPVSAPSDCAVLFERLRAETAQTAMPTRDGKTLSVTVSIGVAYTVGESTPDEMVRTADAALYDAKRAGRDRVVVAACRHEVTPMKDL